MKKLSLAERGRLGGLKKNPNKGFGTNRELASQAPKRYWAKKKAKDYTGEVSVETHAEKLSGDPK